MKNWFDDSWEIHDSNGIIFKGNQDEMMFAWNVNSLNDEAFKQIYGNINRPQKWRIKQWKGDLKFVHVIDNRCLIKSNIQRWDELEW